MAPRNSLKYSEYTFLSLSAGLIFISLFYIKPPVYLTCIAMVEAGARQSFFFSARMLTT